MVDYKRVVKILKENQKIAVFMHVNPDGDCISSAISLSAFLNKCGKSVSCFTPNLDLSVIPEKFKFLPFSDMLNAVPPENEYDLTVGVDVADVGRMGDACFRLFMKGKTNLIIDHHDTECNYVKNVLKEIGAASTTQIIYKILSEYDKNLIDEKIAECIYTGIVTDSGGFAFSDTSAETHQIAAELLGYGINSTEIYRRVMRDVDIKVFALRNRVLSKAEFFDGNSICLISFTKEDYKATGTSDKNTEGIINYILDVKDVETAISVSEAESGYKVSFRTKRKVDAAACARCFGGGGHRHAAGCRLYGYYEDVKSKILKAVREIASYD